MGNMISNLNPELDHFIVSISHIISAWRGNSNASTAALKDEGLIIAIDGKWGIGKTFFISYFLDQIKKDGSSIKGYEYVECNQYRSDGYKPQYQSNGNTIPVLTINYNAYKNDYIDEPFLSLIGQLKNEHPNYFNDNLKESAIKTAAKLYKLTKSAIPVFIPIGGNSIKKKMDDAEQFMQDVKKLFRKNESSIWQEYFDEYDEVSSASEDFQTKLSEFGKKGEVTPLKIFFVDELDRCKPSFAIQLLERIKHFFETKNVIFILTIDRKELISIIKKFYGSEFSAEHYLSRFFSISLDYPDNALFNQNFCQKICNCNKMSSHFFTQLCAFFGIATRDKIRLWDRLQFLINLKTYARSDFYILAAVWTFNNKNFQKVINYTIPNINNDTNLQDFFINQFQEFINLLKDNASSAFSSDNPSDFSKERWQLFSAIINSNCNSEEKEMYKQFIDKYNQNNQGNPIPFISDLTLRAKNIEEMISIIRYMS